MDKTKQSDDTLQDYEIATFLSLLQMITLDYGTTFSIYTSKKGRTWAAFKTFGDPIYASACEIPVGGGQVNLVAAVVTAGAAHFAKMKGDKPVSDSWHDLQQLTATWPSIQVAIKAHPDLQNDLSNTLEALEAALSQNARPLP